MQPRITVITLGVDDLERAVAFYRDGLGLKTDGIIGTEFEHGAVAFFDLQAGLRLALWPRANLAHDAGLAVSPSSQTGRPWRDGFSDRRLRKKDVDMMSNFQPSFRASASAFGMLGVSM